MGVIVLKVKIFTYAYNRPNFITLQQRTFLRFLRDDYEFVVFNSAIAKDNEVRIKEVCDQLGIKCIDVEGRTCRHPSISHAYALQWSFHEHIKHENDVIAMILDSDIFMIKEFSVNEYLSGYDISAIVQKRHITYLFPGLMFLNLNTIPNKNDMSFWCGYIEGAQADTGGSLYYWLKNNPELRIRYMSPNGIICSKNKNLHFLPQELIEDYVEDYQFGVIEKTFLHYRKGSNWNQKSEEFHKNKILFLEKLLSSIN